MRPRLVKKQEPEYYLRFSEASSEEGPFPIEILRQKAESGEITGETWFRREGEDSYRLLKEDAPLAADLWPRHDVFYREEGEVVGGPESEGREIEDPMADPEGNVTEILEDNVRRERAGREAAGEILEGGADWRGLLAWKWVVLRWVLGVPSLAAGIWHWLLSGGTPTDFFTGLVLIVTGVLLALPEILRVAAAPFSSLVDSLMEGGSGKVDYWTADSLMAQGEYKLAAAEYRRIAMQHPREIDAYLKGVKAAHALNSKREIERFRELALSKLKSEQDRNLFLSSLKRIEKGVE